MNESLITLEPDSAEMRRMVDLAMERVVAHVSSLPDQPAAHVEGAVAAARGLAEPMPRGPTPLEDLLELLFSEAVPRSFNSAGPGYLAYIPGGGLFHSAVADLIADSVNRYMGVHAAAPCLSQIEANVVRWFCEIVGYPEAALGFLTSGGSLANLSAVITARCERLPPDFLRGTIYVSDQIHHSLVKASYLAGFPRENVRVIPTDEHYRICVDELRSTVLADRAAGWCPFLLVANAGSTNTGAVDDIEALADLAQSQDLWLHADAAYGGFFMLTERGRTVLAGLERADSMSLDPHKGLFLPYGNGCLLVRDGQALVRTHGETADYLPGFQDEGSGVDFCRISPELSRGFRGIRVWLPLRLHGVEPFIRALDEKLDLARLAAERLQMIPGIEVVAEPQLSVVAFRLRPAGGEVADLDALNRDLLARVNTRGRVHMSGTQLECGFVLRICVLSFRTHRDRIDAALADIALAVGEVTA